MSKPAIRIVKFSPTDYSQGEVLAHEVKDRIDDPRRVGAALSLFFQWPEYRKAFLFSNKTNSWVPVSISYDEDEREPSELRFQFDTVREDFSAFETVRMRFEVFHSCFEGSVALLAQSPRDRIEPWHLIGTVPEELLTIRLRRLPRVRVQEDFPEALKNAKWIPADSPDASYQLRIREIGMRFAYALAEECPLPGKGTLILQGVPFNGTVVSGLKNGVAVALDLSTPDEFGAHFDLYKKIAYPALLRRSDCSKESRLALYKNTGYFEKFAQLDEQNAYCKELTQVWTDVESGTHRMTADYFTADANGILTGASSLVHAFFDGDTPVWAFHQLCAITRPELLEHTRQLYLWRAEYLAARPEALKAVVWFSSKSRWLERIYVKFALASQKTTGIFPVKLTLTDFRASETKDGPHLATRYKIGTSYRAATHSKGLLAGAGPDLLNASKALNAIFPIGPGSLNASEVAEVAGQLAQSLERPTVSVEVTHHINDSMPPNSKPVDSVDRIVVFPKDDLLQFISSLEHSFAVTRKKLNYDEMAS